MQIIRHTNDVTAQSYYTLQAQTLHGMDIYDSTAFILHTHTQGVSIRVHLSGYCRQSYQACGSAPCIYNVSIQCYMAGQQKLWQRP